MTRAEAVYNVVYEKQQIGTLVTLTPAPLLQRSAESIINLKKSVYIERQ